MNRRGFLSRLFTGTVAALAAPQIITHGLGLKRATTEEVLKYADPIAEINPDWVNAPFEMGFIFDPRAFVSGVGVIPNANAVIGNRNEIACMENRFPDPYPIRFKTHQDAIDNRPVPPFILKMRNA